MGYAILKKGDQAPAFTLPNQGGNSVSLRDFMGKWVVLYCYPKDDTPGCTVEAIDFTKNMSAFSKLNAVVLGLSPDNEKSHCKFIEKHHLQITLLCDPGHTYLKKLGVWRKKSFLGKRFMGVVRSTFIIGPKGKIAKAMYGVKPVGHAGEVLALMKDLTKM